VQLFTDLVLNILLLFLSLSFTFFLFLVTFFRLPHQSLQEVRASSSLLAWGLEISTVMTTGSSSWYMSLSVWSFRVGRSWNDLASSSLLARGLEISTVLARGTGRAPAAGRWKTMGSFWYFGGNHGPPTEKIHRGLIFIFIFRWVDFDFDPVG
jgi:uncharacterized SAM-binding protein YcdF (DUF218 family)